MKKLLFLLFCLPALSSPVLGQTYKTLTVKEGENIDSVMSAYSGPDRYKIPRESHIRFGRLLPGGQWNIRSTQKDYGVYDKLLFMRELEDRFIAVVSSGNTVFYLDMDGKKALPAGARPAALITNPDLSKAAVVLADALPMSMEKVNQLSREEQVAFFAKLRATDTSRQVWFSDNSMTTARKISKLSFDATGRHFLDIRPKVFYIDGVENKRDISGGGTQLFVNQSGNNWAYYYMNYLTFRDNFTIRSALHPFVTTEEGKEYLNWFIAEKGAGGTTLKVGRRTL
ncbi:MAG TPA: hypothetical protein VHD83_19050 [Puia sp.]|nr:hypothetical protein [Puia sp.]